MRVARRSPAPTSWKAGQGLSTSIQAGRSAGSTMATSVGLPDRFGRDQRQRGDGAEIGEDAHERRAKLGRQHERGARHQRHPPPSDRADGSPSRPGGSAVSIARPMPSSAPTVAPACARPRAAVAQQPDTQPQNRQTAPQSGSEARQRAQFSVAAARLPAARPKRLRRGASGPGRSLNSPKKQPPSPAFQADVVTAVFLA